MKEAFRRLAKGNPDLEVARVYREVAHSQYKERQADRHKREPEILGGRFEYIGKAWLNHKMGRSVSISMITLKEEWKELPPLLANIEESERGELIGRLAKGLMLSENFNSSHKALAALAAQAIVKNSSWGLSEMSTQRFSPASKVFFEVISDISGYSKEQKALFRDFMNNREDLAGLVRLPQTFPAVAEWLVQSKKNPQSSRLS